MIEIVVNDRVFNIVIEYKNIKKVYLRVENGQIKISCMQGTDFNIIRKLINDNYSSLVNAIDSYVAPFDFRDGGYVYYLGKRYEIILKDMNIKKVVFKKDKCIVYHRMIEKTILAYLSDYLLRYISVMIDYYCKKDKRFPTPTIELKRTKRRYGACFYKQNKVSFNPIIIHHSKVFIDYIIVHELCHFIYPNHSKQFYNEVSKIIPNYKTIIKEGVYYGNNVN